MNSAKIQILFLKINMASVPKHSTTNAIGKFTPHVSKAMETK
jgi:hypothetical protein